MISENIMRAQRNNDKEEEAFKTKMKLLEREEEENKKRHVFNIERIKHSKWKSLERIRKMKTLEKKQNSIISNLSTEQSVHNVSNETYMESDVSINDYDRKQQMDNSMLSNESNDENLSDWENSERDKETNHRIFMFDQKNIKRNIRCRNNILTLANSKPNKQNGKENSLQMIPNDRDPSKSTLGRKPLREGKARMNKRIEALTGPGTRFDITGKRHFRNVNQMQSVSKALNVGTNSIKRKERHRAMEKPVNADYKDRVKVERLSDLGKNH